MSEMINIGGLSAAHGQRVHGFITIGNGEFSLPATIIRGEKPGKTGIMIKTQKTPQQQVFLPVTAVFFCEWKTAYRRKRWSNFSWNFR